MSNPDPSAAAATAGAATGRRVPRLSIPGGLLLALCLFLPAARGCDKPVYPYEVPMAYGPYVFGLLAAVLAFLPVGGKAVVARFAAWGIGTVAAAAEGYFFITELIGHNRNEHRILWPELLLWLPLFAALLGSVRHRRELERWRVQLLWSGGTLSFLFFFFFLLTETAYYGLRLSLLATTFLIVEGVLARRARTSA